MTKVKITGLDKEIGTLRKRIVDAVDDSGFEKALNTEIRAKVRKDGIEPGLADSTIDFRRRVTSKKGPNFSPGRSSLTLSGQLLGAMVTIFNKKVGEFLITVKLERHRPYKYRGKNGKVRETKGGQALIDIWDGLMKDRPVTKVFEDDSFKLRMERRLVSAIKRFFK